MLNIQIDSRELGYAAEVLQEVFMEDLILFRCETWPLLESIVTALSKLKTS